MRKFTVMLLGLAGALAMPTAYAQDDLSGLEMEVREQGTPNPASTKVLALHEEASDTAREHAQKGLDTANSAREDGAQFGEDTAEAAREAHGPPEELPGGRP